MHIKRLLAVLLSTAMFVTSGFSSYATAQTPIVTEAAAEASEESSDEADADASQEETPEVTAQEEKASDEASLEVTAPTDEEQTTEDAASSEGTSKDEETPDEPKDASMDASSDSASEEISEAAAEGSSEDASDAASSEDSLEEVVPETTEDTKLVGWTDSASAYLTADTDGRLKYAEGKSKQDFEQIVKIPKEVTIIPAGFFNDREIGVDEILFEDVEEGDSRTVVIEPKAFENCPATSITLPDRVVLIGEEAFKSTNITSIDIKNVKSIGKETFSGASELKSVTGTKAINIGEKAFFGCTKLETTSFPVLETIGIDAFNGCTALQQFSFAKTLTNIASGAFIGCGLTDVNLSTVKTESLTLGSMVFKGNKSLLSATVSNNVTVIPNGLFSGCSRLNDLNLGTNASNAAGPVKIETNAFENCTSLDTVVTFKVAEFQDGAFGGCTGLETVIIHFENPDKAHGFSISEEAFPLKTSITFKGYDGDVKLYAVERGYKYESLTKAHSIKTADYDAAKGTVELSKKSAKKNEIITVKVTPKDSNFLSNIEIKQNTPTPVTFVKSNENEQVFEFVMPDDDVIVKVTFESSIKGKLSHELKGLDGYNDFKKLDASTPTYEFDVAGRRAQLVITTVDKNDSTKVTPTKSWLWDFASSNTKVAVVDSTGIIRTVAAGNNVSITATLKTDKNKKYKIILSVKEDTTIGSIEWVDETDNAFVIPGDAQRGEDKMIDGKASPVILIDKAYLVSSAVSFTESVYTYAKNDKSRNLTVVTNWKSVDTSIATVASATSDKNSNKITIKKGAVGETMITASVLDSKKKVIDSVSFIIKVVDYTPRLTKSKITVNSLSTEGTQIDLVPVYGTTIDTTSKNRPTLKTKSVSSNGNTVYNACTTLRINYFEGKYYIVNNSKKTFTATYKDAGKLYICGKLTYPNGVQKSFFTPITEVTVTKNALNPTIKTTGKINLFYNSKATADECGKVTVTQSVKDAEVKAVELVSAANYKKADSESPDKFAANFAVTPVNNTTFEITRKTAALEKLNNKPVVSGYLKITYAGYGEPIYKAITVPTCDSAPAYVLKEASATANTNSKNQEYDLVLVDKKTKKTVLDLSTLDTSLDESGNYVGFGFKSTTTFGLFDDSDAGIEEIIANAKDDDTIRLKVQGTPVAGKAVFYVQLESWSKPLSFTFTLKTSNAIPKGKLSASTVTLNKSYTSSLAEVKVTDNQAEADITGFSRIDFASPAKLKDEAGKISIIPSEEEGKEDTLIVKLKGSNIKAGTYSFKVYPEVTYTGTGATEELKPLTLKVAVIEKAPTLKLKSGTLTFNSNYVGLETVSTTYTLGNLPTGVTAVVDDSEAQFIAKGKSPAADEIIDDSSVSFNDGVFSVVLKNTAKKYAGKSLSYTVRGLKATVDSDDETISDFKVTIKLKASNPSVKMKASGTLNPLDETSKITLTATISGVSCNVAAVSYKEKNSNDTYYKDESQQHFVVTKDIENPNKAYITVKPGKTVVSGRKYNITLYYTLEVGGREYAVNYSVVPKQVIPGIKVGQSAATFYAGQEGSKFVTSVSLVKGKNQASTIDAVINEIDFAKGTDAAIERAFDVSYDKATGNMTLELVNPSAIVLNKTYTINFITRYDNQDPESEANKFAIKVTVNK